MISFLGDRLILGSPVCVRCGNEVGGGEFNLGCDRSVRGTGEGDSTGTCAREITDCVACVFDVLLRYMGLVLCEHICDGG